MIQLKCWLIVKISSTISKGFKEKISSKNIISKTIPISWRKKLVFSTISKDICKQKEKIDWQWKRERLMRKSWYMCEGGSGQNTQLYSG